jgi:hypothetical protein
LPAVRGDLGQEFGCGGAGDLDCGEVRELGLVTSLETAGRILGIGRSKAYEMARYDEFRVPLMRVGRKYTVSVTAILKYLGVE